MISTNALLLRKYTLYLLIPAWLTSNARAQSTPDKPATVTVYAIKVVLQNGERCRGTLGRLTDQILDVENDPELFFFPYAGQLVKLSDIKRAVIRPSRRRSARIKGAIVGGLAGLYVGIVHAPLGTFRSSALFSVNLALVTGAGAAAGGLAGHLIGNTKRVVIHAAGSDPVTRERQMYLQLEPYSYENQQDMLDRAGQPANK
ncbi:hypothetical protein [Fibrella forsythiae]|uniref:Glycine zipper family protein n=1 Tax=Fibrella forsythiae TaxID=2817061 RepID=A0ABS3JKM9_9BACT|nr:hypothetical protein [Fibrella forsythiae]MBO0950550.1 hypothetical protein [Fibrella forsythiae]